jgi:hypothetical protein
MKQSLKYDAYNATYLAKAIANWNLHVNSMPDAIALQNFEATLTALHLTEIVEARISELRLAVNYCKALDSNSIIKQTTNITQILELLEHEFLGNLYVFEEQKLRLLSNNAIDERYLFGRGVSLDSLQKQLLSKLVKEASQHESQEFQKAQKKYATSARHAAALSQTQTGNFSPCQCGCKCFNTSICACDCGCVCSKDKSERKLNTITKQEFFNSQVIKENYDHFREGVYRLKQNGKAIVKNAYYLHWDHLHNDVEVYAKSKRHLGSLDPRKLQLYKPAAQNRAFPLK